MAARAWLFAVLMVMGCSDAEIAARDHGDPSDLAPVQGDLGGRDLAMTVPCAGLELVVNGDAEDNATAPWSPYQGTLKISADAHTGSHSFEFAPNSAPEADLFQLVIVDAHAGDVFCLTMWVKINITGTVEPVMVEVDASGNEVPGGQHKGLPVSAVDGNWHPIAAQMTSISDHAKLKVEASGTKLSLASTVVVDDVFAAKVSP